MLAFTVAALAILIAYRIVGRLRPGPVNRGFRAGQIASGGLLALAHGTNDAQKTMGIIALALVAHGDIPADPARFFVPDWVVISAATAIALGAGAARRFSAVRWGVAGNIAGAWLMTIPAAAGIGAAVYGVTRIFGSGALGPLVVAVAIVAGSAVFFARRLQRGAVLTSEA